MKKNAAKILVAIGATACLTFAVSTAHAGGDWSSAKRAADDFKKEYEDLKKLTPNETRSIVTAICNSMEKLRKKTSESASRRVQSKINSEFGQLKSKKEYAIKKLNEVIKDDKLKQYHSKAKDRRKEVKKLWKSIKKMTKSLRGANHPVVNYMLKQGQKAHESRQNSSSYCTVKEFKLAGGRADCIYASRCMVIELKPDNSRAISKGRGQARRYQSALNEKNGADLKKLIKKNSSFKSCKRFDRRVDCYKLCPRIDSDNKYISVYASWRTGC